MSTLCRMRALNQESDHELEVLHARWPLVTLCMSEDCSAAQDLFTDALLAQLLSTSC